MAKYIDEDKLLKAVAGYTDMTKADLLDILEDIPSADVEEVRHGEWVVCGTFDDFISCSVCKSNKYPFGSDFKFCPECGAKMDGERREG